MTIEQVAHRMFIRNVADYADPALAELAWIDPEIQTFWIQQAEAVVADLTDLTDLAGEDRDIAGPRRLHGSPQGQTTR
jgi:hypothetical protein